MVNTICHTLKCSEPVAPCLHSRTVITPPPEGGRGIVFARFISFFISFFVYFFVCFFVSNITRKRLDRFA